MIGSYRILRLLGEGGVGKVYEAADAQGKHYALKAFTPRKGAENLLRKKFLAEANAGEGLRFPQWARRYCAYALPLIIATIFVLGLIRRFS